MQCLSDTILTIQNLLIVEFYKSVFSRYSSTGPITFESKTIFGKSNHTIITHMRYEKFLVEILTTFYPSTGKLHTVQKIESSTISIATDLTIDGAISKS